ncbi:hypothetical protein MMC18_003194 [Xylographa bjoerkii]|nr:hypothetical protein [Xylographa bjoerkii]
MDPVSAAASIAGLYQVVDLVVGRLSTYVKGVQGARKDIEDLSNSVTGLSDILKRLRDLAFEVQRESNGAGWAGSVVINEAHITTCRNTVRRLQLILEKHDPQQAANSFEGIVRKLKWPLQAAQTKSLSLSDTQIESHTTISH